MSQTAPLIFQGGGVLHRDDATSQGISCRLMQLWVAVWLLYKPKEEMLDSIRLQKGPPPLLLIHEDSLTMSWGAMRK